MSVSANYIHLNRLFALRNIAILGQITAILITRFGLDIELPVKALALIILQIILFNGFVWIRLRQPKPVTKNEIFLHLSIDVLALALLLYFTGGASNPFILLFLFPLTITVTILPVRYAWLLAALTVICYSLLMYNYQPLPMGHNMAMDHSSHGGHGMMQAESSEYNLHLIGMWVAFILNACLITYYVYGMGYTLRRQQKQLNDAREQAIRDEQLVILGTLAASTAHELGTPLATMSLLVEELGYENIEKNPRVTADLDTLRTQINRCKKSLTDLSASVDASHDHFENEMLPVYEYLDYIVKEVIENRPDVVLKFSCQHKDNYWLKTDRTLTLALKNIIENATEVSPKRVTIETGIKDKMLYLTVTDNGPGLSAEALANIGDRPYSDKELGLGLGLYLAYSAIRRRQGHIEQKNREDQQGSITIVHLPVSKENN